MIRAAKIFRALCLLGIACGICVALWASTRDAGAEPLPITATSTTAATGPTKLADVAVGLSGPIGATMDAEATGRVSGWRMPEWDLPELPSADVAVRLVLGVIAAACLFVVAAVRL